MLASMANLAPVTLIVGEEEFLVDRALREAVAQAKDALEGVSGSGDGGDLHDLEASVLGQGELFVVPRGVEHCPRADDGAEILLIEPQGTVNTGDAEPSGLTAPERRL